MYTNEIVPVWVLWATDYDGRYQHMISIHDAKPHVGMCQTTEQRKALKTTYEGLGSETVSYYLLDQVAAARAKLSSEDFTALAKAIREGKVK